MFHRLLHMLSGLRTDCHLSPTRLTMGAGWVRAVLCGLGKHRGSGKEVHRLCSGEGAEWDTGVLLNGGSPIHGGGGSGIISSLACNMYLPVWL